MKNKRFSFLLLVCIPICLLAQRNPQPHFRNYSTEHGLPSPEVYVAFQDSKGYMWFGTDNGASRFDGYKFKNYGAKQGLKSNVVFDIYEDKSGGIWFGTMTGEVFILQGDTILPYPYNHLVLQYRDQFNEAALAHLSQDGSTFFELLNLGILTIDSCGTEELITTLQPSSRLIMELEESNEILSTYIRRYDDPEWEDNLKQQHQTNIFNIEVVGKHHIFRKDLHNSNKIDVVQFRAYKTVSDELLVFYRQRLYCLQDQKLLWVKPWEYNINELIQDEEHAFWICGGIGKGLRRYQDLDALKEERYSIYLNGLSISNIFQEKQNGFWVTSQEKGIFYSGNNKLFSYGTNIGFSSDFVNTITYRNETEVYVGCQNGDIYLLDLEQNLLRYSFSNPWGYHNFDLLYVPEADRLWSNGAYWQDNKWHHIYQWSWISKKTEPLFLNKLDKVHLNAQGKMVGCHSSGYFILDINELNVRFSPSGNSKFHNRTFAVHTDRNDQLWIGNTKGLFSVQDSTLIHSGIEHPAFHTRVEDIDEFPDSNLVFGTKGWGVVVWKDKDFTIISEEEGLTTNMIEDVHVDENGILWVGTLNGLNKVTFDKKGKPIVRQFTMANGLPSNEIYKIKSYKGQVWLCTAGGLVKFHEQPKNTVAKAPTIQKLVLNGKVMEKMSQTRFSYQENNFAFHFLTINYHQNGNINYRFRLNSKADWSYTQNLSVNYPQLSPGEYQFEVQAQNEDGFWSESTSYGFEIRPPWWATSWFIGLLAMSFISSGFGLFQYRIAQLKKESLVQQQMTELERAALQAQMNPHFIFNCLNSIQNFILQNDTQKAVEFLSRFARLVRLNLNASVEGFISLEEEIKLLDNYLALEQERFDHRFDYQIEMEEGLEDMDLELPPMLIQPFVENAIVHGISQQEGQGKVHIKISKTEGHFLVKVQDNGTGHATKPSASDLPKHKSVGMSITQKRLGLLDAALSDTIKITLLTDDRREQIGTEVTIRIKTKNDKKL